MKRRGGFAAVLGIVAGAAIASAARAQLPEDVTAGVRAEVEGSVAAGSLVARELEIKRAKTGDDQVEGALEAVDPGQRSLRVAGVRVALDPAATVSDDGGRSLELGQLEPGQHASVDGRFADGVLRARSVELSETKAEEAEDVELEGTVADVDRAQGTFRLLGVTVRVTPRTEVEID